MKDEEYITRIIRTLEYALNNSEVPLEKGTELAGDYLASIREELHERKIVGLESGGNMYVTQQHKIPSAIALYKGELKNLKKIERDRWLNNTGKWFAIIEATIAIIIAGIALYRTL